MRAAALTALLLSTLMLLCCAKALPPAQAPLATLAWTEGEDAPVFRAKLLESSRGEDGILRVAVELSNPDRRATIMASVQVVFEGEEGEVGTSSQRVPLRPRERIVYRAASRPGASHARVEVSAERLDAPAD